MPCVLKINQDGVDCKRSIDDLVKKTEKLDIGNYGLQGLSPNAVLYRVCRDDQDTNNDIVCKAKPGTEEATRTVNQHINSGSRLSSQYISTSASSDVVLKWTFYTKETPNDKKMREKPLPIIKIYLSKLAGMEELNDLINLTNKEVREYFVSGATQISRVKSSQEVLFQWCIPKKIESGENVSELWENPSMPLTP